MLEDENNKEQIKIDEDIIDKQSIQNLLNSQFEESYLKMKSKERRRFWRDVVKNIKFTKDQKIDFELLN